MPFDPTDPKYTSPLAAMAQDRMTGMLNQPQMKVFADAPQDGGTNPVSPIMPGQTQLNRTMGMAKGGAVNDELSGIKDTIRAEFAARGLDFDRFVQNPAVMDEVGKSIQSQGSNGDTILAHINPEEAQLLKEMGGSGTVNPATGLPQFDNPSMGAYDAPSGSIGNASNYIGGSNLGGYGGSGSGSQSFSGNGNDGGSRAAGIAADRGSVSGYTGGDGGSSNNLMAAARSADRGSVAGYTGGDGGVAPILSPMGVGGGSIPMGQRDAQIAQTTRPEPSVPSYDLMSGTQIGGTSNLSGLGQLAAVPSFTGTAIAPQPTSVDLGNTAPQLSDIDFSNISPGMYQGATMPGGISNFASSPVSPGYVDPGVTAMRLAASDPTGRGTEYYMGKLSGVDPRVQGQFLGMINDRMAANIPTAITPRGSFRTTADQIALAAEKAAGLNPNVVSAPGTSLHELMTIDPYTGEKIPGSLALDVGGRSLTPAQTNQAIDIANSYGLYGNQIIDPGHFQAVPFQKGAMQLAQAKYPSPNVTEPSTLQSALNTVSNIASELFGVKSAQAEEMPQQNELLDNLRRSTSLTSAEPMSPFGTTRVASQQQMLDALGISGSPIPTERAAPPEQVAGSGVFPSYPKTAGTQAVPVAGKIGTDPQSGRDLFVDINSNEFTVNPGTGARQYTKFSTSTPASPVSVAPSTFVSRSVTPPPKPQTVVTGLTPVQKAQDRAPGASTAGLTGFEAALGTTPVAQASSLGPSPQALGTEFTDLIGTTPQGNYLFSNLDLATKTIPNTAIVDVPKAIDIYDPFIATPQQVYRGLIEKLTGTPEKPTGEWSPGLTIDPETGLPTTGVATWNTPNFSKMTPEEIQDYNASLEKYRPAMRLTPQREITKSTTDWSQPAAGPYQSVSYDEQPTSFAGLTPLSPLQQTSAATASPVVSPRVTTGLTSPITARGTSPRQEPLDPTQSTSPITAEQLQSLGVYQTPLKEGQRVRDNFNEAYGDATARGIEVFEWTNPATGETDFYKSGAPEADLPVKTAKTASLKPGQKAAPQTEYEKTVATLEANDMIANGMSKEEYAAAMGVPVEQVKTRITTQFGPPMAEYYTKTVLESLAGMTGDEGNFSGLMNLTSMFSPLGILGLAGKAGYNAYRKRQENKAEGGYISPLASMGKR